VDCGDWRTRDAFVSLVGILQPYVVSNSLPVGRQRAANAHIRGRAAESRHEAPARRIVGARRTTQESHLGGNFVDLLRWVAGALVDAHDRFLARTA